MPELGSGSGPVGWMLLKLDNGHDSKHGNQEKWGLLSSKNTVRVGGKWSLISDITCFEDVEGLPDKDVSQDIGNAMNTLPSVLSSHTETCPNEDASAWNPS